MPARIDMYLAPRVEKTRLSISDPSLADRLRDLLVSAAKRSSGMVLLQAEAVPLTGLVTVKTWYQPRLEIPSPIRFRYTVSPGLVSVYVALPYESRELLAKAAAVLAEAAAKTLKETHGGPLDLAARIVQGLEEAYMHGSSYRVEADMHGKTVREESLTLEYLP